MNTLLSLLLLFYTTVLASSVNLPKNDLPSTVEGTTDFLAAIPSDIVLSCVKRLGAGEATRLKTTAKWIYDLMKEEVEKKKQNDLAFLEIFQYYNEDDRMDKQLPDLLFKEFPHFLNADFKKMVEDARKAERTTFKGTPLQQALVDSLNLLAPEMEKEGLERRVESVLKKARDSIAKQFGDEKLIKSLQFYNDDTEMDILVAWLLCKGKPHHLREIGKTILDADFHIARESTSTPAYNDIRTDVRQALGKVQQARQTITELKKQNGPLSDIDERMADLLIPIFLELSREEFVATIQQARAMLKFRIAIREELEFAVLELTKLDLNVEGKIFERIVHDGVSSNNYDIVAMLVQQTYFSEDMFPRILDHAVKCTLDGLCPDGARIVSILLKNPKANGSAIDQTYATKVAESGNSPLIQAFQSSGKVNSGRRGVDRWSHSRNLKESPPCDENSLYMGYPAMADRQCIYAVERVVTNLSP